MKGGGVRERLFVDILIADEDTLKLCVVCEWRTVDVCVFKLINDSVWSITEEGWKRGERDRQNRTMEKS